MCLSDDPVISKLESFFFPSMDSIHVIGLEWASKNDSFIQSYKLNDTIELQYLKLLADILNTMDMF